MNDVETLSNMIDTAAIITRRTFLKHVNRDDLRRLESQLGYAKHPTQGLTMSEDWCVTYHKSKLHDEIVYFFTYSAIEYIFKKNGE